MPTPEFWQRVHARLASTALGRSRRPTASWSDRTQGVPQRPEIDAPPPRILLLTSALGSGHVRATQAIHTALLQRAPTATIQVLDWWSLMNTGVARAVQEAYLRLVQEHSQIYENLYHLDQSTWRDSLSSKEPLPASVLQFFELLKSLHAGLQFTDATRSAYASDRALVALFCATIGEGRMAVAGGVYAKLALLKWSWARLAHRLERRIAEFNPDVIVSTQMIPAALVSTIKQRRGATLPSVAVPTDFGVHDFWHQPGTDLYCLGHESVTELPAGLDARRLVCTGFPLMPEFTRPVAVAEARRMLGLTRELPVILVLGGGLGLGVEVVTESLLQVRTPLQLLVLAGRNLDASRMLTGQLPSHVKVFNWTERVDLFIRAADIVVGKPGGLTVAEVLACGRPLLATRSLRGQEGFNVRFIQQHQAGCLLDDAQLVAQVESLLAHPAGLAALKARAWRLGRRDGAEQIATQILALASTTMQRVSEYPTWHNVYET